MQVNTAAVNSISIAMPEIESKKLLSCTTLKNSHEHMETVTIPLQEYSNVPDEDGDTKDTIGNYDYGLSEAEGENNESCLAKWAKEHPVLACIATGAAVAVGAGLIGYSIQSVLNYSSSEFASNDSCNVECNQNNSVSFNCPKFSMSGPEFWANIEWKNPKDKTCTHWDMVVGSGTSAINEPAGIKCARIIEVKTPSSEEKNNFTQVSCRMDEHYT